MGKCKKVLFSLMALGVGLSASAHTISVFATQRQIENQVGGIPAEISGNPVHVYEVDRLNRLNHLLTLKLRSADASKNESITIAKTFVQGHLAQFRDASQSVAMAMNLGVKRVPAIVIDGKYQILGTLDPELALETFNAKVRKRGGSHAY